MPLLTKLNAAESLPSRVVKALHRALPITVPPCIKKTKQNTAEDAPGKNNSQEIYVWIWARYIFNISQRYFLHSQQLKSSWDQICITVKRPEHTNLILFFFLHQIQATVTCLTLNPIQICSKAGKGAWGFVWLISHFSQLSKKRYNSDGKWMTNKETTRQVLSLFQSLEAKCTLIN